MNCSPNYLRRRSPVWQSTPEVARQTTIAEFLRQHGLTDLGDLLRRADAKPGWYWQALLEFFDIRFVRPYSVVLDVSKGIEWPRWCVGGTTNVVLNCLDKHRDTPVWQPRDLDLASVLARTAATSFHAIKV